jgi:protein SCO1/2
MNLFKKNIHPVLGLVLVFAVLNGIILYRLNSMGYFGKGGHLSAIAPAPAFELNERGGRTIKSGDLAGKVWVGNFIFTRCAGPCPLMSVRAQELVRKLPGVTVVSFTSDPSYDTPEILAKYADRYKADADRWLFLTGPMAEMSRIAKEFKFGGIDQPDLHSTRFVLVDGKGQVRGYYDSNDPESLVRLERDAKSLV